MVAPLDLVARYYRQKIEKEIAKKQFQGNFKDVEITEASGSLVRYRGRQVINGDLVDGEVRDELPARAVWVFRDYKPKGMLGAKSRELGVLKFTVTDSAVLRASGNGTMILLEHRVDLAPGTWARPFQDAARHKTAEFEVYFPILVREIEDSFRSGPLPSSST